MKRLLLQLKRYWICTKALGSGDADDLFESSTQLTSRTHFWTRQKTY